MTVSLPPPRRETPDRILSLKEVANRTSYSIASIRRLSRAGEMPPIIRIGANRVGMSERLVQQWIAQKGQG